MKNKKVRIFSVSGLVAFLLCCVWVIYSQQSKGQYVATIRHKGEIIATVDLMDITEEYTLEIGTREEEFNLICFSLGSISVLEANCPDQVCVLAGESNGTGKPIVCLPHRLLIEFETEEEEFDGFSG